MEVVYDEITSSLNVQIFDFCDPLLQEPFQTSEVTSPSNCDNSVLFSNSNNKEDDNINNNYPEKSGSFNGNEVSNANTASTTTENNNVNGEDNNGDLSIIFDPQEDFDNDISASIDFSSSLQFPVSEQLLGTTCQDQFDFSAPNIIYSSSGDPLSLTTASSVAPPPLQSSVFEEDCLSSVPSYNIGLNPSSPSRSFYGTPCLSAYMVMSGNLNPSLSSESSGLFAGNIHLGCPDLKPHDPLMDYPAADNGGIFYHDSIKPIFNPGDLQVLGSVENKAPPSAEISCLDEATSSKVGRLSAEQRKEKIHRYMKKRNERNFSKKIKYACRKTLADSRPRVRGRFAKNDELGELHRQASSSHHDDDDEDDDMGVKEEEQMVDSSDIFSHISGVNSFKCNFPIQSWI
ncbi:PREDICTED: two-component response regulator-like APRR7 isoform X2 [Tarenaya hassleriana]|uniref:two-component response regulator-like APRR7 isoform X2 n=1 Tax=Tarenaya hassleriana TaxID=28532 RepID=UPI00053C1A3C|nr:PREDICTED: two-component response regulator-like APRR7 isoform X2 [Tarenaya hassleriana]